MMRRYSRAFRSVGQAGATSRRQIYSSRMRPWARRRQEVDENAEDVWIAWWRSDDVRLIVSPSASAVDRQPDVTQPKKRRFSLAQYRRTENVAIERHRALNMPDDERIRHHELQFSALTRPSRHDRLLS